MNIHYTIKDGDSLSKIAKIHGLSAHELAQANGIHNPNIIRIGKKLIIPGKTNEVPTLPVKDIQHEQNCFGILSFEFVDAINKAINALKVRVLVANDAFDYVTDNMGKLPPIEVKTKDTPVQIHVKMLAGGWKKIGELNASIEELSVRIISPKIKLNSEMAPHEGSAQLPKTQKPSPQEPGTVTETRSSNGNPVQKVALECPNPENLKLTANYKYRDIIIAASKRSGISPQAIAALMNAEAATLVLKREVPRIDKKTGKPLLDKHGKPIVKVLTTSSGEWDAHSASKSSSARGMTQFLDGSWISQALIEGTFLNLRAKKEGWVTQTDKGKLAFKLSNGNLVTASKKNSLDNILRCKPHIIARATASDANLQALLDLRFEPEYAINTAVDYGLQNLKGLKKAGLKIDGLNDSDKAKLFYLTHHLGLDDAKKFIKNSMTSEHAKYLLIQQVGAARASVLAKIEGGNYLLTHRKWLSDFINKKIMLSLKMCDESKLGMVRELFAITETI